MTLLDRVKQLCISKNISQSKLETEIGISRGASYKWKSSSPSMEILKKLADYFNVSVEYLITGEEKEDGETYYLNEETKEIAHAIFENQELFALFEIAKSSNSEDLQLARTILLALKRKEQDK